jgi:hypothetical protein
MFGIGKQTRSMTKEEIEWMKASFRIEEQFYRV